MESLDIRNNDDDQACRGASILSKALGGGYLSIKIFMGQRIRLRLNIS
jgi:hypothetical protein